MINISKMNKAGEDVSKYVPALEKYMYESYIADGISEKDAKSYMESFEINRKTSKIINLIFDVFFIEFFLRNTASNDCHL